MLQNPPHIFGTNIMLKEFQVMDLNKAKIPLTQYAKATCMMHYQTKMEIHINE